MSRERDRQHMRMAVPLAINMTILSSTRRLYIPEHMDRGKAHLTMSILTMNIKITRHQILVFEEADTASSRSMSRA